MCFSQYFSLTEDFFVPEKCIFNSNITVTHLEKCSLKTVIIYSKLWKTYVKKENNGPKGVIFGDLRKKWVNNKHHLQR